MLYEIQSKNDLSGAMLIVRFPEEQLDRKALYTIQADMPGFLVPFHYRNVDGQIECVYYPGNRNRLHYYLGCRKPEEYVRLWEHILEPLLECGDWFCKPSSFVLDLPFLFIDKDSGTVSYLYVPSNESCMERDALKNMAVAISHQVTVTDQALENQVLRALMQDFQPKAFVQMLRKSVVRQENIVPTELIPTPMQNTGADVIHVDKSRNPPSTSIIDTSVKGLDDIEINLNGAAQTLKKEKGHGLFGGRNKKEKESKKQKIEKKGGFFGKKGSQSDEIILGAGAELPAIPVNQQQVASVYYPPRSDDDDLTSITPEISGLHLKRDINSDSTLPESIPVKFRQDGIFTIGRFSKSVGGPQSCFEFAQQTQAVSRHHAAITRMPDGGFALSDIGSKAGTYLNGEKLVSGVQYRLNSEDKISFGTAGANYIWKE